MNLPLSFTRALGSGEFFLRKNAPTILTGAGVIGFIATIATTIHSSPKAMDTLQAISIDVQDTKERLTDTSIAPPFTDKQIAQELSRVYLRSSVKLARVYGPTMLLGSASIICVISGHNMMLKRQAQLVAAYGVLSASYEAYRKRVADKIGKDEELELYRGVRVTESCSDEGEPCEIIDMSDSRPSPYSVFFDETSPMWKTTAEYNRFTLKAIEDWANRRLQIHGFLFLNEVLDQLSLQRTQAGQVVGWIAPDPKCRNCKAFDDKCKAHQGDGYVDFGMYDIFDPIKRAFVNGQENVILLDFNVDGPIQI